jgi:hypothetical protein
MEALMQSDQRLALWLALANELESFDHFMREQNLAPTRASSVGMAEVLDCGADVARRMRLIATNRWTWYGWKRDRLIGEASAKFHTFHRWIAEGFFFGCDETDAGREMMARFHNIEHQFQQLVVARS